RLVKREQGIESVLAEAPAAPGPVRLGFEAHGRWYQASYSVSGPDGWTRLGSPVDGDILTSQVAGGFTGVYIGLYATANGRSSGNHACFDWFEYRPLRRGSPPAVLLSAAHLPRRARERRPQEQRGVGDDAFDDEAGGAEDRGALRQPRDVDRRRAAAQ